MAKYQRREVIAKIHEQGLMPLVYSPDVEVVKRVADAFYKAGARLIEFTNRGDFAHEVFAELVKYANAHLDGMMVGAGSIHDSATASLYIQNGANFIVSASIDDEVARTCNRRKVLWSPGCGTVTEIDRAESLGAEIVKVFPGNALGSGFVKAVLGPRPWTSIMVTGGVSTTRENLSEWFDAGAVCVGIGSKLMSKQELAEGSFDAIENRVRDVLATIKDVKA